MEKELRILDTDDLLVDGLQRSFKKLRVSLTNQCNLLCTYCVSGKSHIQKVNNEIALSVEGILCHIKAMHEICGFTALKLTGGEPLLFNGIELLVEKIFALGVPKISITTNGFFLKQKAAKLHQLGVQSINVSLDAATPELFHEMTQKDAFKKVIAGIETAVSLGIKLKVNTVIMKGVNEDQILPLLALGDKYGVEVRFLEVMKMGHFFSNIDEVFFPQEQMLSTVSQKYSIVALPREKHVTANYWQTNTGLKFGIIANESSPFCSDCDRLRLDSYGKLYGCISSSKGVTINDCLYNKDELLLRLRSVLGQKQKVKFKGSPVSMLHLGG